MVVGVILSVAISHGTAQQKTPPPPARVAVVDLNQLFNAYLKAIDYGQMQRNEEQKVLAEDDVKRRNIETERGALGNLKAGSADYEKQVDVIEQLTRERQFWQSTQDTRRQRVATQRMKEMYDEMVKASATVARQTGCNMVMVKEPADISTRSPDEFLDQLANRKLLYADNALDITESVLSHLNETYRAAKK